MSYSGVGTQILSRPRYVSSLTKELQKSELFRKMSKLCEDASNFVQVNSEASPIAIKQDSILEDIDVEVLPKQEFPSTAKLWKDFRGSDLISLKAQENERTLNTSNDSPCTFDKNESTRKLKLEPKIEGLQQGFNLNSVESVEYLQRIHMKCMDTNSNDTLIGATQTAKLPTSTNLETVYDHKTGTQCGEVEMTKPANSVTTKVEHRESETTEYETVTQFVAPLLQKRTVDVLEEELRKRETVLNSKGNGESVMVVLIKIPKNKLSVTSSQTLSTLDCIDSFNAISSQECARLHQQHGSLSFKDSWDNLSVPNHRSHNNSCTSSDEAASSLKTDKDYLAKLITIIAKLECISRQSVQKDAESYNNVFDYLDGRLFKGLKENERILQAATHLLERTDYLEEDNKLLREQLSNLTPPGVLSSTSMKDNIETGSSAKKRERKTAKLKSGDGGSAYDRKSRKPEKSVGTTISLQDKGIQTEGTQDTSKCLDELLGRYVAEKVNEFHKTSHGTEETEDFLSQLKDDLFARLLDVTDLCELMKDNISGADSDVTSQKKPLSCDFNENCDDVVRVRNSGTCNLKMPFHLSSQATHDKNNEKLHQLSITDYSVVLPHNGRTDTYASVHDSGDISTGWAGLETKPSELHDGISKLYDEERGSGGIEKGSIDIGLESQINSNVVDKKPRTRKQRHFESKSAETLRGSIQALRLQHYQDYQIHGETTGRRGSVLLGDDYIRELAKFDEIITSLKRKVIRLEEEKLDLTREMVDQWSFKNYLKSKGLNTKNEDGAKEDGNMQNSGRLWKKRRSFQAELLMRTSGTRKRVDREESIARVRSVNDDVMKTVESAMSFL